MRPVQNPGLESIVPDGGREVHAAFTAVRKDTRNSPSVLRATAFRVLGVTNFVAALTYLPR